MEVPTLTTARKGAGGSLRSLNRALGGEHDFVIKAPGPSQHLRPQHSLSSAQSTPMGSPDSHGFHGDSFISTIKNPRHIKLDSPGPRFPDHPAGFSVDTPGPGAPVPMPPRLVKGGSVKFAGRELFGSIDYAARSSSAFVPGPGTYSNTDPDFVRRGLHPQAPALKGRVEEKQRAVDIPAPDYYQCTPNSGVLGARPLSTQPSLVGPRFTAPSPRPVTRSSSTGNIGPGQYYAALEQDRKLSTRGGNLAFSLFSRRDPPKAAGNPASPQVLMPQGSCGVQPLSTKPSAPAPALKGRGKY